MTPPAPADALCTKERPWDRKSKGRIVHEGGPVQRLHRRQHTGVGDAFLTQVQKQPRSAVRIVGQLGHDVCSVRRNASCVKSTCSGETET